MNYIRLKTDLTPEHIENRLSHQPEMVEIHLDEKDLYQPERIEAAIQLLQSKGVKVYLHHPPKFQGGYLDIISSDPKRREFYDWSSKRLVEICHKYKVKCVIHCHYANSEGSDYHDEKKRIEMKGRIEEILEMSGNVFLWEDTIGGIFSAENPLLYTEIVEPLQLPLNIDISHSFIALKGSNHKLKKHLNVYARHAEYFHLVDSEGKTHDSLQLGKGKIDWKMVKPFVEKKDFIFEIGLSESKHLDCKPMVESARYFGML